VTAGAICACTSAAVAGRRGTLRGLLHAHLGWRVVQDQSGKRSRYVPGLLADAAVRVSQRAGLESDAMRVPWRRARSRPPAKTRRRNPPFAAPAPANLGDIEAQARYHRDRLALYGARMHGSDPTSIVAPS
jgi:hypothetical protein